MKLLRTSSAARSAVAIVIAGSALGAPAYAADAGNGVRGLPNGAEVTHDGRTGALRVLERDGRPIGPSAADPARHVLDYVRAHAAALGVDTRAVADLRPSGQSDLGAGLTQLVWTQERDGLPVSGAGLKAVVDATGRIRRLTGPLVPAVDDPPVNPAVDARTAYRMIRGGAPVDHTRVPGLERATVFSDGGQASLVVNAGAGRDRLAWRVLAPVSSARFEDAIVDAATGAVIRRQNRVRSERAIKHFVRSPAAENNTLTMSTIPERWLAADATTLRGRYVHAVADVHDEVWVEPSDSPPYFVAHLPEPEQDVLPVDEELAWSWPFEPDAWDGTPNSWQPNLNHSVTQLFWYVNRFRDHLATASIGFDASSGGFEGDDPVIAQAMDGAAKLIDGPDPGVEPDRIDPQQLNNANMLTLPDGSPGFMQMYLFAGALPGGQEIPHMDGADDASLVYHEYAHGLTGRLVTWPDGWDALWSGDDGGQSGAIAEGTSDWYALDYLVAAGDETDGPVAGDVKVSELIDRGTDLIRYDGIDCPVGVVTAGCAGTPDSGPGGFTFADYGRVDGAPEVHGDGEIWAQTLWDLRAAMMAAHDDGLARARRYITGGLRLAPPEPTLLEMRDAIIASAEVGDAADAERLWAVFAKRGMGWSATTADAQDTTPIAAQDLPPFVRTDPPAAARTTAELAGALDPRGTATAYRFEYAATGGAVVKTPLRSITGAGTRLIREPIAGLAPSTTYHVRLVGIRGANARAGKIVSFTTAAVPPPPPPPPPEEKDLSVKVTSAKAKAGRKGVFTFKVRFGDDVPEGKARVRVELGGKTLASGRVETDPGGSETVRLKLKKSGRKAIKPGRKARKVHVSVVVPGAESATKTMRLSRKR